MKKPFLFLLLALCMHTAYSGGLDSMATLQNEFVVPDNKVLINESLDEIKQKIDANKKSLDSYQDYLSSLKQYKSAIDSFRCVAVDSSLNRIKRFLKNKLDNSIFQEEQQILGEIDNLRFYLRTMIDDKDVINRYNLFASQIMNLLSALDNPLKTMFNMHLYGNNNTVPYITDATKASEISGAVNGNILQNIKTRIGNVLKDEIQAVSEAIKDGEDEYHKLLANRQKLIDKLDEQETQINGLAIKLGLPLFCGTILLLFLGPTLIRLLKKDKVVLANGETEQSTTTNSQNVLLEISTVLLLTMSILILGLSGKISSEVLGTLIGGISGYVLNRTSKKAN